MISPVTQEFTVLIATLPNPECSNFALQGLILPIQLPCLPSSIYSCTFLKWTTFANRLFTTEKLIVWEPNLAHRHSAKQTTDQKWGRKEAKITKRVVTKQRRNSCTGLQESSNQSQHLLQQQTPGRTKDLDNHWWSHFVWNGQAWNSAYTICLYKDFHNWSLLLYNAEMRVTKRRKTKTTYKIQCNTLFS